MRPLQDWILQLTTLSRDEICTRFGTWALVRDALDKIIHHPHPRPPYEDWDVRPKFRVVSPEILNTFAAYIRGLDCEEKLWSSIASALAHPLPLEIAHDLLNRKIAVLGLCLSFQHDEILHRAMRLESTARKTFILKTYLSSNYSPEEFKQALENHPYHWEIMKNLCYSEAGSRAKHDIFMSFVWLQPNSEDLKRRMATRRRDILPPTPATGCNFGHILDAAEDEYITEEYGLALTTVQNPRIFLTLANNPHAPSAALQVICATSLEHLDSPWAKDSIDFVPPIEILQAAARNPNTPLDMLNELTRLKNHFGSRHVREAAAENLQARLGIWGDSVS